MRVVQAFVREEASRERFREVNRRYRSANQETVVLNGALLPVRRPALVGRDGGRARLRRLSRVRRLADDRHALRVHRLPRELLRPGAAALAALQHVPRRRRRAGQDHRRDGGGARDRGRRRRAVPRPSGGQRRLRRCPLRVRHRPRSPPRPRSRRPGRHDGRPRRAHRSRQVDDREAPRALLRPDAPAGSRSTVTTSARSRRRACAASSASCPRRASSSPGRSTRTSPSRGPERRSRTSSQPREQSACTTSWRRFRTGTRPRSGSVARGSRSGNGSSIAFARALLADPRILDPRRGHVQRRHRHGAPHRAGAGAGSRRAHRVRDRAPALDDPAADLIVVLEHGQVVEQGSARGAARARRAATSRSTATGPEPPPDRARRRARRARRTRSARPGRGSRRGTAPTARCRRRPPGRRGRETWSRRRRSVA